MKNVNKTNIAALLAVTVMGGTVAYGQITVPPASTPVTIQGEVRIQPEDLITTDEDVNVQIGVQLPSLEDTGNPNTFYVVQLTGDAEVVTTEISAGGVLAETNGDVTLSGLEQTETTVSYLRAVRIELENGTLIPQGAPVPVGGYINEDGDFIELGEMTGADGDGNAIFAPGDLTPAQLALITQEPVITSLGGGNLDVGGNANVEGDAHIHGNLELGEIEDVESAITGNTAAINQEIEDRTALIRREDAEDGGRILIGGNTFVLDDTDAMNHRITTDTPNGNLVLGGGTTNTQVVVDSGLTVTGATSLNTLSVSGATNLNTLTVSGATNLNSSLTVAGPTTLNNTLSVAGPTTLGSSLTVAGPTTLNGGLLVDGSAVVTGQLTAGSVADVERSIITNEQEIRRVDTRVTQEVNRLDGRINANARRISQNRAMINENRAMIQANTAAIERLDSRLDSVKSKAYSGVAAAASLGTLVTPSEAGRTAVMAGMAFYEGEGALGVNATHRIGGNENDVHVNLGISVTTDSTVLGRAMVGMEF